MKQIIDSLKKSWRVVFTSVFVLLIFTVPASKSLIGKFFSVHASGGDKQGMNQVNNFGVIDSDGEGDLYSSPSSSPSASPVQPGNSCSSGFHARSDPRHDGKKDRANRPNGR